jgi:hypothetical protein
MITAPAAGSCVGLSRQQMRRDPFRPGPARVAAVYPSDRAMSPKSTSASILFPVAPRYSRAESKASMSH